MSTTKPAFLLPAPAIYFPITEDQYSTRAALTKFGHDFGNGQQDRQLFQLDNELSRYRKNKLNIRNDTLHDYVCTETTDASHLNAAATFILQRLCQEHPEYFSLQGLNLDCRLTGEQLQLDSDHNLLPQKNNHYENLFDALALQVQEDICLMHIKDSIPTLTAAHLCAANHWSAREKLNMDMSSLHTQVPGFENENRQPNQLLTGLYNKSQPYVRFAWGLSDQPILNQHPSIKHIDVHQTDKKLWIRIERQVIWPIANTDLVLFTIRTYFRDCSTLEKQQRQSLRHAINSMSDATLKYKHINKADVLKRLECDA